MKVTNDRPVQPYRSRRVGGGGAGPDGPRFSSLLESAVAAGTRAIAAAPAPVEALLGFQEVREAAAERAREVGRGSRILDRLDDLRAGLLAGTIRRETLDDLVQALEFGGAAADPALASLLDEIELRARVELAKLGSAA